MGTADTFLTTCTTTAHYFVLSQNVNFSSILSITSIVLITNDAFQQKQHNLIAHTVKLV